jgi:4'-phosphopantetheinyl transferase
MGERVMSGVSGQVLVWYALTESLSEPATTEARDLLSPDERARGERFRFADDRRDFTVAHALLRRALTQHEGVPPSQWVFQTGPQGKPFLAPAQSALEFNLAHTRGLVACALTKAGMVGVDVESIERAVNCDEIAERYFSETEILALQECRGAERQTRFIELWTLKEAYLKAIGAGLSNPLGDFGFELHGTSGLRFSAPPGTASTDWRFALFAPSTRHRMAVAVRTDGEIEFSVQRWPAGAADSHAAVRKSSAS